MSYWEEPRIDGPGSNLSQPQWRETIDRILHVDYRQGSRNTAGKQVHGSRLRNMQGIPQVTPQACARAAFG
jgi:hypothetical protein